MSKIEIMKAEPGHASEALKLLSQLGYESTLEDLKRVLAQTDRSDEIYIAKICDKVVGLMSVIYFDYFPSQEKICRITAIVVDQNARGTGVGSQLIDFAKGLSKQQLCSKLEVTTSIVRQATQQYYENIGFTKTSYRYAQEIDNL
ncbi:GNAT family N-acetyltransferase [Pseudoalteromonas sp. OOF1S-7]|uniref:GNAT family N-acetyltransferase n=1 Tax=Pseudoalteromonas sp. OOF1S-7 TaxID=2917757 RepID=UPI001EF5E622|nr:GNAT family N-acetyltransferase [Pseudoalteromonas sp. OOF1S-7]MCG7533529.1 GNAT family N-acetyltransferase [Pseudoalteromonas sp. OOF1S-7]